MNVTGHSAATLQMAPWQAANIILQPTESERRWYTYFHLNACSETCNGKDSNTVDTHHSPCRMF